MMIRDSIGKYRANKETLGGGARISYYSGKNLRMVEVKTMEPMIKKNVSWYYNFSGEIIFSETRWTDLNGKIAHHEMLYANKEKLIEWQQNGENIDPHSNRFKDMDTTFVHYGKRLKNQVAEKK